MAEEVFRAVMQHDYPEIRTELQGLRKQLVYLGIRLRSTPSRPAEELAREQEQVTTAQAGWLAEMKDAVKARDEPRAVALAQRMVKLQESWTKRGPQ
jgi:hypothetical protein